MVVVGTRRLKAKGNDEEEEEEEAEELVKIILKFAVIQNHFILFTLLQHIYRGSIFTEVLRKLSVIYF